MCWPVHRFWNIEISKTWFHQKNTEIWACQLIISGWFCCAALFMWLLQMQSWFEASGVCPWRGQPCNSTASLSISLLFSWPVWSYEWQQVHFILFLYNRKWLRRVCHQDRRRCSLHGSSSGCASADAVRRVMIIINGTFKTGLEATTGEASSFWRVSRGVVLNTGEEMKTRKKDCLPDGL